MLPWYEFAFWGFFGGVAVDGLEFWRRVKANNGDWPPELRTKWVLIAECIRLCTGAGLAVAFGLSGQVTSQLSALAIGTAAPLILEKLSQQLPPLPSSEPLDSKYQVNSNTGVVPEKVGND